MTNKTTFLKPSDKKCPVCGSYHIQGISRITGYLSLDERFGEGKVNERKIRRDHNAGHDHIYTKKHEQIDNLEVRDNSISHLNK
jgi:ribonucleoside-triphosphate reductase